MTVAEAKEKFNEECTRECDCCLYMVSYGERDTICALVGSLLEAVGKKSNS